MKMKSLPMKRALRAALLVLLLSVAGMTKMYAFDFSAVCETGQTLYYNITDSTNHYVSLTCPGGTPWYGWSGFTEPTGDIILPSTVDYDDVTYTVISIGDYAFAWCTGLTGSLEIPNSVASIGSHAFYECYGFGELGGLFPTPEPPGGEGFDPGDKKKCGLGSGWPLKSEVTTNDLIIGNSVTSIGDYAFYWCSGLTGNLEIPNSMTSIGSYAFSDCSGLTSITIPNSVTSIGSGAFSYCSGLEQIIVEEGNLYYDSREDCNAIIETSTNTLIKGCNTTVIPNSVTSVGDSAFSGCSGLTSITIPNSVISIGDYAFSGCSGLTSITIPNSVTSIGSSAFSFCSGLEQIIVEEGNPYYVSREDCNAIIETNTNTLIIGCKNTIIPNSVTSIGEHAFYGSGLISITIPNSVTSIGSYAFSNCSGLTSVTIGNSVTSIDSWAFSSCSSLMCVTIGNSVTSIGDYAFGWCTGLTSMTIFAENPPTTSGSLAFYDVNKSIPVYVPCGIEEAYASASWGGFSNFYGMCGGMVTVAVEPEEGGAVTGAGYYEGGDLCVLTATPNVGFSFGNWMENGVVVSTDMVYSFPAHPATIVANFCIDDNIVFADANVKALCVANWDTNGDGELSYAEAAAVRSFGEVFRNNSSISSFDELQYFIGLTSIGNSALYGCSNLTSVTIGNFVTSIASYTFYSCTSLTSIEIPNSVTSIDGSAFSGCSGLTSIEIPNSVTSIGNYAFSGCSGLTSVTIGNSVTSIGSSAFNYCNGLASMIVLADNPPSLGLTYGQCYVFNGVDKSIPVYVPCGTLEAYQNSYYWRRTFTNFQEIECQFYEIIVTATPTEGGTVTGGGTYTEGTTCTLTATPNAGYIFLNWTKNGEEVSTGATYSFTVTEDATLVANFETNIITQTINLSKGWNWWSSYIELSDIDGLSLLENSIGIPNVRIESKDGDYVRSKVRNGRTVWVGALTSINNEEMYKIGTKTACTATMEGIATDPANHPITINRGWNWIGFPCDHSVSVSEAMSGFSPKKNDMIKGKDGSATYSNGTWSGTLNTLEPGQGYMYGSKSNATKTLVFQTGSRGEATQANITPENNYYQPAEDYADNMTVIAVVELDGEELRSDNYELAAFAGDECRGSVKLMYVEPMNRYVAFLTVFGDESEDLHFVLTDGATSDLSANYMTYATDGIEGTLDEPVVLRFGATDVNENASVNVRVYPNPSEGVFNIEGNNIRRVEVFNALGQPVCSMETESGFTKLDLTNHASGIYLIRVISDNGIWNQQIMKR